MKDIRKVEENWEDYYAFEQMQSWESFKIIEDFIETIDDIKVKYNLVRALEKRKPFRDFKHTVDYSGEYRELWFAFRDASQIEFVKAQINRHNSAEENGK